MNLRWCEWIVVGKDASGTTIGLPMYGGGPWRESFTRDNGDGPPMDRAYGYARHIVRLAAERPSSLRMVKVFPRSFPGHGETFYVED